MKYRVMRDYSVIHDCVMSRVSVPDDRGLEYFAEVSIPRVRGWNKRLHAVLDQIEDAILSDQKDGKVRPREIKIDEALVAETVRAA